MGGVPIAFYTLRDRDGTAWIGYIWVSPDFIGKGVGKELFLHAADLARQRGAQSLQLEAEPYAVGFYEKMGMQKIGEHRYDLDGQLRILPLMEIAL